MKKTKKKLSDYVPYYIGQELISYWGEIQQREIIQGFLYPLIVLELCDDDQITSSVDLSYRFPKGREPKIVLRKLSDMKPDELHQLELIEDRIECGVMCKAEASAIQTKKLIDWGYDVFGLIECGLAVDRSLI